MRGSRIVCAHRQVFKSTSDCLTDELISKDAQISIISSAHEKKSKQKIVPKQDLSRSCRSSLRKCDQWERCSPRILSSVQLTIFIKRTIPHIGSQHFFPDWIWQSGKKSWVQKFPVDKKQKLRTKSTQCTTLELPESKANKKMLFSHAGAVWTQAVEHQCT